MALAAGAFAWLASSTPAGAASTTTTARRQLSSAFSYQVLQPPGEAPLNLRLFSTAVKTDSRGQIITAKQRPG
jgi:hypothetical protein